MKSSEGEFRRLGISESILNASSDTVQMTYMMVRGLTRLVTGQANEGEMVGLLGLQNFQLMPRARVVGFLIFMALISINLGLVNLLPIPALDGGHLLFLQLKRSSDGPCLKRFRLSYAGVCLAAGIDGLCNSL